MHYFYNITYPDGSLIYRTLSPLIMVLAIVMSSLESVAIIKHIMYNYDYSQYVKHLLYQKYNQLYSI